MFNKSILYNSFDWFQGTVYCDSALEVFKVLENVDSRLSIDNFTLSNSGLQGYSTRYMFQGKGTIQICWNPTNKLDLLNSHYVFNRPFLCRQLAEKKVNDNESYPGVFIAVSGDGLRFLGCNQFRLFEGLYHIGFKPTRIDVAIDFFDPDNDYIPFLQAAFHNEYYNHFNKERDSAIMQTKMNRDSLKPFPNVYPSFLDEKRKHIVNWQFGGFSSHKGKVKLYDKWLEVHTVPRLKGVSYELCKDVPEEYWWRLEYSVKDKYANNLFLAFIDSYLNDRHCNMSSVVLWCLNNFFEFRIFKTEGYQISHLELCQIWKELKAYFESLAEHELNFNLAKYEYVRSVAFHSNNKRQAAHLSAFMMLLIVEPSYAKEILKIGWKTFSESPRYSELREDIKSRNPTILSDPNAARPDFALKQVYMEYLGYTEEEFDKFTSPF